MYMLVVWVQILLRERTESTFAVGSAADSAWSWQGTFVEAYMQSGLAASCVAHSPFLIGEFVLGKAWGLEERTGRKEEQTEEGNYQVDDKPKTYEKGLQAPASTIQTKTQVDRNADGKGNADR